MRKFLILALAAGMLTLSGCGLQRTSPEPTPEPVSAPEETMEAVIEMAEPEPTPEPTPTMPPLPDIDLTSFQFMLANSWNSIGWEYEPIYNSFEGQGVDERIMEPLGRFVSAAREAGYQVYCSTLYRNWEYLYNRYMSYFNNISQDPVVVSQNVLGQGLNEHQTGLCVDFTDDPAYSGAYTHFDDPYMRNTELYDWLVEHCADYGFILRYPEGKEAYYGVACNHPAHFRYVGEEAAHYIMDNDLCLEEFLLMYEGNTVFMPNS